VLYATPIRSAAARMEIGLSGSFAIGGGTATSDPARLAIIATASDTRSGRGTVEARLGSASS